MRAREGRWGTRAAGCVAIAAIGFVSREASAAVNCSSLVGASSLVIESGDTQEPLLKTLGKKLRDSSAHPVTVLYRTTGTCTLIDDMYKATPIAQGSTLLYMPTMTDDPTWDPSKAPLSCTVDEAGGLPIQLAIAATFTSSCTQSPPPGGLATFNGPIQGYSFIAPKASTEVAITAEEGYFVWGFGNTGGAAPWTDENFLFGRPATKSTALTLAAAVGLPAGLLKGLKLDKSTEVLNDVATSPDPQKTLGLMGVEVYDANRDKVNVLAFRAFKQRYAYYPDSQPALFDKQNLRDGHYVPWAPTVYIGQVDGGGVLTDANTKLFYDLVMGNTTLADVDGLAAVVAKGLVPDCAMRVKRDYDGGPLSLYTPADACGCYYESKVPNGSTSCASCTNDGPCGAGKCRHGYCEAK